MFGTVQEMNPSKSGRSQRLKINGKWLIANFKVNLDGVSKGTYVEYEEGSFAGDDGKPVATIARIRPAQEQPHNGGAQSVPVSAGVDEASLRFISNVVGSAITAKTIESPTDIKAWTLAAQEALKALSEPKPEFDDSDKLEEDMPEKFYENLPPAKARERW